MLVNQLTELRIMSLGREEQVGQPKDIKTKDVKPLPTATRWAPVLQLKTMDARPAPWCWSQPALVGRGKSPTNLTEIVYTPSRPMPRARRRCCR